MADYHPLPAHVVSKRIKEAMETFPLKGVQFIPAIIYDDNDKPHHDYFKFVVLIWKNRYGNRHLHRETY